MNVYVYGLEYEPDFDGDTPERQARAECEGAFGTSDDCLVVDVLGAVLLNTTGVPVERICAS